MTCCDVAELRLEVGAGTVARLAATYPGLDEATRDELLGPQREHYGRVVVDGLAANPHIEVPARYRDEWDELVAKGS